MNNTVTEKINTPVFEVILEELRRELVDIHEAQMSINFSLSKIQSVNCINGADKDEPVPNATDIQSKFSDLIRTFNCIKVRLQADAAKLNQLV